MRATGTKAGIFLCSVPGCGESLDSYDGLVRHVYDCHRALLLEQTRSELPMFQAVAGLAPWADRELSCLGEDPPSFNDPREMMDPQRPMDGFGFSFGAGPPGHSAPAGYGPVFGNASERG
jgi:hypothetical protein